MMEKTEKMEQRQLQLTGVHLQYNQQVSHPDPCASPAQQIDQKGLSSVKTTALFEPSWWMSLGTLPPRVTAGPSLCPGMNLMYDPRVFWAMLHINTHKSSTSPIVVLCSVHEYECVHCVFTNFPPILLMLLLKGSKLCCLGFFCEQTKPIYI